MPRRRRVGAPGIVYHVLNRANRRDTLFHTDADFRAFETVLFQAKHRYRIALYEYVVMRNHFHLIVQPGIEHELSRFMQWMTMTHTQRWHRAHGTTGTGSLYQGRFKAVPVQSDAHFLIVARYVQRNPARAGLVERVEEWRWSSAWHHVRNRYHGLLDEWPVSRPAAWWDFANELDRPAHLDQVREAVTRSVPFGDADWTRDTARALGIPHSLKRVGRPAVGQDRRPDTASRRSDGRLAERFGAPAARRRDQ